MFSSLFEYSMWNNIDKIKDKKDIQKSSIYSEKV